MTDTRTPPGEPGAALLSAGRFFRRGTAAADLHSVRLTGGREGDAFYRDRWSHDKVVHSTHGVNCTGSCRWKVYVKDGIITWETQETDYPSVGPDRPEYEPRGCPRGAAFSWYTYSPVGPGMGGEGPFGGDSGRRRLPLVSVETFHALTRRQTTDRIDDTREV